MNQSLSSPEQRGQKSLKVGKGYWDANLNRVSISNVQQVNDRAFYKRANRWIDSSLLEYPAASPKKIIEVGSDEFRRLTERLAAESRQGCIAPQGEILLRVGGEVVLVR